MRRTFGKVRRIFLISPCIIGTIPRIIWIIQGMMWIIQGMMWIIQGMMWIILCIITSSLSVDKYLRKQSENSKKSPTATNWKPEEVAKGGKQPRFAAQRESLGLVTQMIPSLKATNISTVDVARLQRAIDTLLHTQRFSLGYNVGHLRWLRHCISRFQIARLYFQTKSRSDLFERLLLFWIEKINYCFLTLFKNASTFAMSFSRLAFSA